MPYQPDPERLEYLKKLERISSAEERREELLKFAKELVDAERFDELRSIDDLTELHGEVQDLVSRGPDNDE